jgi:hypothetical protein
LAKLDAYFRAGVIDPNLSHDDGLDIKDLRKLMIIANESEYFKVDTSCYLNPNFGKGSVFVGGADADLIIDDTLIDLKVSKRLILDRNHLNQLIGYYILSIIGGINDAPDSRPIKNIGVYFARHGVLWKSPILSFSNETEVLKFKNWFIKYVKQKYRT